MGVIWDWVNAVFSELGKRPVTRQISAKSAARIGGILEWLWRTFGISGSPHDPFCGWAAVDRSLL